MNSIKERLADPNSPEFLTPVGRLVSGNLWDPRTTDYQGNPLTIKSGPNQGQGRQDYSFGIAIQKNDPGLPLMFAKMTNEAKRGFPRLFDTAGNCTYRDFAFKFQDGDSAEPNRNGVKPCDRQGWRGCFVFFFSGSIPTKVIGTDPNQILTDHNSVLPGYYIRVSGSFKENGNQQNPGIYVNHNFVQFVAYGEQINFGPSAEEVFSDAVTVLPPGASATPLAPTSTPAMGLGTPGAAPIPPASPAAPGAAPIPPVATGPLPTAPATGWLNPPTPGAAAAPAPTPAPAPAAPIEKRYMVGGVVYTEAQLRTAGHTDAHLATYQVVA